MAPTERVVYLEDLDSPSKAVQQPSENATPGAAPTSTVAVTKDVSDDNASSAKRQRTLMDMFSGGAPSGGAPPNKKIKITAARSISTHSSSSLNALTPLDAIEFSVSQFQQSLSDEEKKLLALECETMGTSWLKVLHDEIRKPYFIELKRFLYDAGVKGPNDSAPNLKIYPAPKNIYAWSKLTPLGRVKVVIIGQDPYHGPGQAHGLCFSVPPGVPVPPSLRNIYAEIKQEYPQFEPPKHGNLTGWAADGVLLLNTCLTVRAGDAGSHSRKGWETFTDKVVDAVDRYGGANLDDAGGRGRGIVFLAWGAWAAKRVSKLDKTKHLILTSAHPSPLSASRGFLGNGHFKKANDWLREKYGDDGCVHWCKLSARRGQD
ncbi:uracil-DNA glycosylase [Laetiporus sulphureus 93-53]|uniref:Uracil-DNA glycosylase n=1 Tax=Laetiporus sulphureus 93-53 TaxID=1314785 RepID=A0A165ETA4_9APHY|nr:uracil-DNA glycosylase [Laetiporus sulphureus 93-53]KZT07713.1 uracil-DNA glycosylase [Laetiporus sulphureus 93-53]